MLIDVEAIAEVATGAEVFPQNAMKALYRAAVGTKEWSVSIEQTDAIDLSKISPRNDD